MSLDHITSSTFFWVALFAAAPVLSVPLSTVNSTQTIIWRECEPHRILSPEIQCGKVSVPINWDEPEGVGFDLEVMRLPRRNDSTAVRLGSLFINPGGPGSSTEWTLIDIAGGNPAGAELKASFDIIGLDPRGVGLNAPSNCSAAISNERVSLFPKTKAEYDRMVDKYKRLGESCLERMGTIANYLDTISTAKDHEAVRLALGGEDMNWLGLSYGSQLGAQYAQLFPDNIRTMVLDGIVQHSLSEASNALIETSSYAAELRYFFKWASENDRSVLRGQDVERVWDDLLNKATETPLPTGGCNGLCHENVTADEIRTNAQRFVASSEYFAQILKRAVEGSATVFASPKYNVSDETEHFDDHSAVYASLAIGCQDWSTDISSFEELQAKMRMAETFSPLTSGASQTWTLQASCIGWPTPLRNPPAKLNVQTKDPILMVNAIRDSSTSYVWALGMLEEIKNHVLLTRNGGGHVSWGQNGATQSVINHYLLTKELPAAGTILDS